MTSSTFIPVRRSDFKSSQVNPGPPKYETRRDATPLTYGQDIDVPDSILNLTVEKGSICIDGISLTVAAVSTSDFKVSVIPHTGEETTLLKKKVGDIVNLESDIVGKYVKKVLFPYMNEESKKESSLTMDMLKEYGF